MIEIEHLHGQSIEAENLDLCVQIPTEHCRLCHGLKQSIRLQRVAQHTFAIEVAFDLVEIGLLLHVRPVVPSVAADQLR